MHGVVAVDQPSHRLIRAVAFDTQLVARSVRARREPPHLQCRPRWRDLARPSPDRRHEPRPPTRRVGRGGDSADARRKADADLDVAWRPQLGQPVPIEAGRSAIVEGLRPISGETGHCRSNDRLGSRDSHLRAEKVPGPSLGRGPACRTHGDRERSHRGNSQGLGSASRTAHRAGTFAYAVTPDLKGAPIRNQSSGAW